MAQDDPRHRISAFLTDGNGSREATGEYLDWTEFSWVPASGRGPANIRRINIIVRDTGAFDAEKYGNAIVLTKGLRVRVKASNGNTVHALDGGRAITVNAHWGSMAGVDAQVKDWGTGDEFMIVRYTFGKGGPNLRLANGDYLAIDLYGDFEGLNEHNFMIQGQYDA